MRECLSFLILWDPLACVIRHWNCDAWWSVCGHTPQLTVQSVAPANLGEDKWRAGESFIIEINASARGKWGDNVIITPQASCFYFSICLLSLRHASGGHMAHRLCVCACLGLPVCARVCVRTQEGASTAQKIPLREICIGLLCYSRLSGTLVRTYLSMSEQTAENKLICFSPPSSLSSPSFTCFLPSLSLYINLCLTRRLVSSSSLFSSPCFCKMQHCPKKIILLSVLLFSLHHKSVNC